MTGPDPVLFYAGAPIVTAAGLPLGTLCVLDRTPRRLSASAREALRLLAAQAMRSLELHDALAQQDAMRREVDHRVKNSLANVAAMTRMAARTAPPEAREVLGEVERRITVMVELHGDLYRVDDPNAPIEVMDYLGRVAGHLGAMTPPGVALETRFDPVALVEPPGLRAGRARQRDDHQCLPPRLPGGARRAHPADGARDGRRALRGIVRG